MSERDELAAIIMSPESFDGGPVSCGPNDIYAARIADAILAAGYSKHSTELAKAMRGAKTLGEIIEKQCRDVLDVTGLHHLINEDGDGAWDVVWMRLFEMRDELASLKESTIGRERLRGDSWRDRAQALAAADAYDAAHGTHRLSLDDATVERAARATWVQWDEADEASQREWSEIVRAVLAAAVKEER